MAVSDLITHPATPREDVPRWRVDRDISGRLALVVFLATEVALFITVLVVARAQWFKADDWDFLELRRAGSITDLFAPHNGHWSTLPILVYRALFHLVGLRTYLPYLLVVLLLHLTAGVLLRMVMRRANVGPWIATVAASVFVLFGAGYQDIIGSFDININGALVFGLTQLLLAGHDGPIDRRDWLGLLAGTAGLMCSNVAVTMSIAVGLATLIRRGWRPALFQTGPLAAFWLIWWFGIGRPSYTWPSTFSHHVSLTIRWFTTGVGTFFETMGQYAGVGVVLGLLLVVGLVLAWTGLNRRELRIQTAAPAALLITAFIFVLTTGWEKVLAHGVQDARESRYLHMFAAMVLPAMAVAVNAIASRWRVLIPAALGLLVIGIPSGLQTLASPPGGWSPRAQTLERQRVLTLATLPVAHQVPRSALTYLCTDPLSWPSAAKDACTYAQQLTIGWLLDQKAAGRLPNPGPVSPTARADATLLLALQQSNGLFGSGAASQVASAGSVISSSAPTPSAPSSALVNVANNPKLGSILVDSKGMTLYTLTNGYKPLACPGNCGAVWPLLLVPPGTTTVTGGPGITGLATTKSGTAVTYWGYPLARFSGDKAPGETNGNGRKALGGTWHVVGVGAARTCSSLEQPVTRTLEKGQSIQFKGGSLGVIYESPSGPSDLVILHPKDGSTATALAGPLTVRLLPAGGAPTICS